MLSKVKIYSNLSAAACEAAINQEIEDNPGYDISYEMMIEGSIAFRNDTITSYTLVINIENVEEE